MKKSARGFTLIELIVVIAIVGILAGLSFPVWKEWLLEAQYRQAAREVASILREARSRAISENLEHEAAFDLVANNYMLRQGDRAYGTPAYSSNPGNWTVLEDDIPVPGGVDLRGLLACSDNSDTNFKVQFNPNGTGENETICILDDSGTRRYRARVTSTTTGRVVIQKYDTASSTWQ